MRMGGMAEVAVVLGVSRQRVARLRERPDFPDPIAEIAQGHIWDLDQIQAWGGSALRLSSGRPPAETAARTLGGRFVLEESRIGHGGFADVYRAFDRKQTDPDRALVAVKVLRDVHEVEPEVIRRFQRELRLLESIQHPNVVSILGQGETTAGGIWYAMPLAQGSLVDFIDEMHGQNALVHDLIRQVCDGLDHIHQQGIFHRDLKPGNILRFADRWAISDFGLAVEAERQTTALTSTLRGVGTPWFTAPEQWRDARSVDHHADIFSLGKILQALALGDDYPINEDVPPGPLRPIIQKATANRPEQRYDTVTEFYSAFESAITAPSEPWESAEAAAQRLLERVRLPKAAAADLDQLLRWSLALDENNDEDMTALSRVLPWISGPSISHLWDQDPQAFRRVFTHYSRHLETSGFTFDYCDVLADFSRKAVVETGDPEILREAIGSLVALGHSHNRWHVRSVVTAMLQGISETEHALAATEALRTAASDAVEWTLTEFSIRSLPPVLRAAIENLRTSAAQPPS